MNMRTYRWLIVLVLAVALTAGAGLAASGKTVAQLRADARELLLQQSEMFWNSYVYGKPSDQASLYRQYEYLFTLDSIGKVKKALAEETDADQKRALDYFLHYLEVEYIGNQTAELNDIYFDLEAQLKVLVDGKLVPYRSLHGIIANESDPARRAELAKEEYRTYGLLNSVILRRIIDKSHRLAKQLGYSDYLELSVVYKNFDLETQLKLAREFLDQSEEFYLKWFDELSDIPRDKFRRSDISRLLGAKQYDEYFTRENLLPSAMTVFDDMGLGDIARNKIKVHDEELEKKVPRAACFPIRVPEDVRMTIKPIGGISDYSALYHEFGHAQHFANGTTPIWEFQQLGSYAVTEGYAYIFESLPEREEWLKVNTKMNAEQRADFRKRAAFAKLYMARRYMAKLIYETEFHRGVENPQARYQYWLSKAYGFQLTDEEATRYLSDLDPFLYATDYVQAFYLEAMLNSYLTTHFGAKWWENKKSGAFLQELWTVANKWSGVELARKLGFAGYDNQMLFEYIRNIGK